MIYPPETTLGQLIERYAVFLVDQFGVLRDDAGAYPGAIEALAALKAAGRKVVILSNSGRSGAYNADRFVGMGFSRDSFDHFVTSGDVAHAVLSASTFGNGRCFTISSGDDRNLADRLGLKSVETASEADLVVVSGSEAERIPMDRYREMLRPAAEVGVPCICTNPDMHKLANGTTAPGAGAIARLYEEMGGTVRWFGKPYPDIYRHALALCGNPPAESVVCIGDSIEHDILGATGIGLASVLTETGILAERSREARLEIMQRAGAWPSFTMPAFERSSV